MLRTERIALLSESAASGRRAGELVGKLAADDAALAKMTTQLANLKPAGGSAVGNPVANNPTSTVRVVNIKDVIRDHPEWVALERKEQRRNVVRQYGRAIAALSLSADQATQLKELLVEREVTSTDAQDAATQAGLRWDSEDAKKSVSEATKDLNQAINSLIGSEANEKLEALKDTANYGSLNNMDNFALDMVDAGVAMSPDQSQALAQWLHDLPNPAKNPDASTPGYKDVDHTTWQSPLDQQFFAKAATMLTPTQLQVLMASCSEDNQRKAILNQYIGAGDGPVMITN
jgi:hypothetical protein